MHVWRVDLRLRPSRFFLLFSALLHAAALVAVYQCGLSPWLKSCLCFLVLVSAWLSWRQELARAGMALCEHGVDWHLENGIAPVRATLMRHRVWRYLVVLDFRVETAGRWRRHRLVIFPDSVPADVFRRLRVRLHHAALPHDA
uniref:Toxin CptA n=1 Tax=uncultured bacterium UPO53 TaxID=1776978 RepID=A0A126SYE6_9BACT|nr:hypothetical protein GP2143_08264 [uncultured bacterium UPO53]